MPSYKPIGGFFGEEEELLAQGQAYHSDAIAITSGRAALRYILEQKRAKHLYLPYYCCDTVLQPLKELDIPFTFYAINEQLEPIDLIELGEDHYFLYINYFGFKGKTVSSLQEKFGDQLIVDNTQAFFERGYSEASSFNSARKFFGVPDGAYLYGFENKDLENNNPHVSTEHLKLRADGKQAEAYVAFQENEAAQSCSILAPSAYTLDILGQVNYQQVQERRKANFNFYKKELGELNSMSFQLDDEIVPFAYPFVLEQPIDRSVLYQNQLFIPTLWPEVLDLEGAGWEKQFTERLLPLPIDHRYTPNDLQRVVSVLKGLLRNSN